MRSGRPKTSLHTRAEQLREAKRRQRDRQRSAGIVNVQFAVSSDLAAKIAIARRTGVFAEALDEALDRAIVRIRDYPQLASLAWNRGDEYVSAREAFELYERNWRFIDEKCLVADELRLLQRLKAKFGAGVINA